LSLVVPGVPESSNAYQLTAGGMETLKHKRVTGGTRVTLDEFGLTGLVLFAQDPLVINSLSQRAVAIGRRSAELRRTLAAQKLRAVEEITPQLAGRSASPKQVDSWISAARQSLQLCDMRLTGRDYSAAYLAADRTMRALRLVERSYWDKAVEGLPSPLTSPCAGSFLTLPAHWRLATRVAALRMGQNRLAGGDFENLGLMMQAGWRHFQHPSPAVQTAAELVSEAAHTGTHGLRLTARAEDPATAPAIVESPPLWITTAPLPVEAGQLVCIHGWVAIPAPITGSVDGLLVVDSLAGEDLALRIHKTSNWQEFTVYRAVPRSGPMTVTFVLSGLGEVRLDDWSIHVLEAPTATAPAIPPATMPAAGNVTRLPPAGPLR
jgi:hypothetical protein